MEPALDPPADALMSPLEPGAVHFVAWRLTHQPAVGLLDGGAVVDHTVDLACDRHWQAVFFGELHDHTGSLDALGDLVHRRDDLVDRLTRAQLLADMAVAAALAGAGDRQIAHTRQTGEGVAVPAHRLAHLRHLTQRARDHHGARILA